MKKIPDELKVVKFRETNIFVQKTKPFNNVLQNMLYNVKHLVANDKI